MAGCAMSLQPDNYTREGMTSRMVGTSPGSRWKLSITIGALIASFLIPGAAPQQAAKPVAKGASAAVPDVRNPFDRYLADTKGRSNEPALERFAKSCGVNVAKVHPGYAERFGEHWKVVKALTRAPKGQETETYNTLELWQAGPHMVTEQWDIEAGDYYRMFACLLGPTITSAESVSWNVPDQDSADEPAWGYEIHWELKAGKFARVSTRFLNLHEEPIAEPRLDEDRKKDLDDQDFDMHTWKDLDYPAELVKEGY